MFAGTMLRWPFCLAESQRLKGRRLTIAPPPVFIIGHWRSGTTFLHNLMSRDQAFCFPTISDALRPYDFLPSPFEPISRSILMRSLPAARPMDDLPLQPNLPQEDEIAMATMGAALVLQLLLLSGRDRHHLREGGAVRGARSS
jgi:hypothetical protein